MWMQGAASDINAADTLLASPDPSIDAICCFHAHAALEKWLKALIVVHTQVFPPKTHDLARLLPMQRDDIRSNVAVIAACTLLMSVYPKSCYPEAGTCTNT